MILGWNSPFYSPERFTYHVYFESGAPEHNRYICPAGQPFNYGAGVIATVPAPTSEPASVVVRAHKEVNAPAPLSGL